MTPEQLKTLQDVRTRWRFLGNIQVSLKLAMLRHEGWPEAAIEIVKQESQ